MVLTIAGFDPSSGAGVTADLQVFAAHGLFGTSCITALTVQSTIRVSEVESVSRLTASTLESLDADLPASGIKIGMLCDLHAVLAVSKFLRDRQKRKIPVVLDPVLVASSGRALLNADALAALRTELLPLVNWITPNISELTVLSAKPVEDAEQVELAMRHLHTLYPGVSIVATGGHLSSPTDTLLTEAGKLMHFEGELIDTNATHGTGCAFSSALLSRLVQGDSDEQAVRAAKAYVAGAMRAAPTLGSGKGPLNFRWQQ